VADSHFGEGVKFTRPIAFPAARISKGIRLEGGNMRLLFIRTAVAVTAASVSVAANADTFYGYCTDHEHSNVISSFFTYEGDSGDYDEIKDQWEEAVSAQLGIETYKIRGNCYASSDRAKAETPYNNILGYTDEYLIEFAPRSQKASASPSSEPAAPRKQAEEREAEASKGSPAAPARSAAQVAAEEAAARRAKYEAEFQAKQADYQRKLAEQQRMVDDYKRAQDEVARTKAEQQAKADAAAAAFKAEQEAYAEKIRQHDQQEAAAKQLLADWDKRNGLGQNAKASTDEDANRCVTTPETQLNASFKGNTAASVINGCGQSVDVRICLMTSAKGWNCGVTWGLGSQQKWSHSSFDATGQLFVDARVSGSSRALASPR